MVITSENIKGGGKPKGKHNSKTHSSAHKEKAAPKDKLVEGQNPPAKETPTAAPAPRVMGRTIGGQPRPDSNTLP